MRKISPSCSINQFTSHQASRALPNIESLIVLFLGPFNTIVRSPRTSQPPKMGVASFAIKLIAIPVIFVLAVVLVVYLIKKKRSQDKIERNQAPAPAALPWSINYNQQMASPAPVYYGQQQYYVADVEQGQQQTWQQQQVHQIGVEPTKVSSLSSDSPQEGKPLAAQSNWGACRFHVDKY